VITVPAHTRHRPARSRITRKPGNANQADWLRAKIMAATVERRPLFYLALKTRSA
jgi:hypothetical protein